MAPEVKYGVTRTMTLRNLVGTQIVLEFGGVVFSASPIATTSRADSGAFESIAGEAGV